MKMMTEAYWECAVCGFWADDEHDKDIHIQRRMHDAMPKGVGLSFERIKEKIREAIDPTPKARGIGKLALRL